MKYLSVCSGIEAASVAWQPLGWKPVAFSEIEKFPSSVLAHRFPGVPNLGNILDYENWNIDPIDLLVGGTPCQSFSVAGKRGSLADDRGNLCLTFCRIADKFDPEWVLWENVPGVLNTPDNAFGCFLGKLCGFDAAVIPPGGRKHPNSGVVSGPKRTVAWRVLDAQWFGVPQRRRRVFVLASRGTGNFACADALLPVGESLPGHLAKGRKAGKETAGSTGSRTQKSHWDGGAHPTIDARGTGVGLSNQELFAQGGACLVPSVSPAVTANRAKGSGGSAGDETQNLVVHLYENHAQDSRINGPLSVAPTISAKFGTGGNNTPIVQHQCMPLDIRNATRQSENDCTGKGWGKDGHPMYTLTAGGKIPGVSFGSAVRRLTPRECERLQGFPDDWTLVPYFDPYAKSISPEKLRQDYMKYLSRGGCGTFEEVMEMKFSSKTPSDSVRYKAIGNSMAVPCMAWIGKRISIVSRRNISRKAA